VEKEKNVLEGLQSGYRYLVKYGSEPSIIKIERYGNELWVSSFLNTRQRLREFIESIDTKDLEVVSRIGNRFGIKNVKISFSFQDEHGLYFHQSCSNINAFKQKLELVPEVMERLK
jgi:hypothetical protein